MTMPASDSLVLTREFSAPIERVFEAWTNADMLAKWFGPEGFSVTHAEIDLTVGGHYDIEIRSTEGHSIRHFGRYVEIFAPHKLVFTWILGDQDCKGSKGRCADTLVTVEFNSVGQSTQVTLTHECLPDQAACDGHEFGWTSSFKSLAQFLLNQ